MGLTNEHVEPKILAKIKIYVLTRAELLFTLCYEIPCSIFLLFYPKVGFCFPSFEETLLPGWNRAERTKQFSPL